MQLRTTGVVIQILVGADADASLQAAKTLKRLVYGTRHHWKVFVFEPQDSMLSDTVRQHDSFRPLCITDLNQRIMDQAEDIVMFLDPESLSLGLCVSQLLVAHIERIEDELKQRIGQHKA